MPPRPALFSQRSLFTSVVLLLGCGFLATSLLSYFASLGSLRDNIVNTELPLTSDTVYSEIQKDLVRPILISSMMSRDTFLRDWILSGERDPEQMTRYLKEVVSHYGAFTAFLVSNPSLTYYQAKGVLKKVAPEAPRDVWYFRVRDMHTPYEINVDVDMANQDKLTFFINYQVFDYENRFIGATGVGLTVDAVIKLIDRYQERYQRSVYFVDQNGKLVLTGASGGPAGARIGQALDELPSLRGLSAQLPKPASGSYEYDAQDGGHFLNVRFIPELNWYLFVDKRGDKAFIDVRQSLYWNLAICLLVTLVVVGLLLKMVRRFQRRIEALATVDSLTGLPNRRGFDLLATQAIQETQRESAPLYALLLDLDQFKSLNDSHGHLAGDEVLIGFAQVLQECLRKSDIICRWGGEEFVVILKDTSAENAQRIAEAIRTRTENHGFVHSSQVLRITTSIGLTGLQGDDTLQSLIARADHALYRAKKAGRNRVCSEQPHSAYE